MILEHALAQRLEQSTTWTAEVPNIDEYVSINATKSGKS